MDGVTWQTSFDFNELYRSAKTGLSQRKKQLLMIGLARRVQHLVKDSRCLLALKVLEWHVDGQASTTEVRAARRLALAARSETEEAHQGLYRQFLSAIDDAGLSQYQVEIMNLMMPVDSATILALLRELCESGAASQAALVCHEAIRGTTSPLSLAQPTYFALRDAAWASGTRVEYNEVKQVEQPHQCDVLREIVGNPFRPSVPLPSTALAWNDSTVRRIAQEHLPPTVPLAACRSFTMPCSTPVAMTGGVTVAPAATPKATFSAAV